MSESLGSRIRSVRKERGLTLSTLSEQTGLSLGFLSNLEHDETSPSIANLHKVCNALDVNLNDLLLGQPLLPRISVVRSDARPVLFDQGDGRLRYTSMTAPGSTLQASSMLLDSAEWVHFAPHNHDELGIVAQGEMEMRVGDEPTQTLRVGDAIFIPSGTMHSARCTGNGRCESYWIKSSLE